MIKLGYIFFPVCLLFISCSGKNEKNNGGEKKPDAALGTGIANPYASIDLSPMDMSYFPANYSQRKMTHDITEPPVMRIIYSRPHRQGRTIFGNLLHYGERWRLGANEASEIEFFQNVSIQNKKVNAGRYIIYSIPYEDKWTIILNDDLYTWGLKIDSTKDIMQFDTPVKNTSVNFEYFTMVFQPITNGAELVMAWDNKEVRLPINF